MDDLLKNLPILNERNYQQWKEALDGWLNATGRFVILKKNVNIPDSYGMNEEPAETNEIQPTPSAPRVHQNNARQNEKDIKESLALKSMILMTIKKDIARSVSDLDSPKKILDTLHGIYGKDKQTAMNEIRDIISNSIFNISSDLGKIKTYIANFKYNVRQYRKMGGNLTDYEVRRDLLAGIPHEFNNALSQIRNQRIEDIDVICTYLTNEEELIIEKKRAEEKLDMRHNQRNQCLLSQRHNDNKPKYQRNYYPQRSTNNNNFGDYQYRNDSRNYKSERYYHDRNQSIHRDHKSHYNERRGGSLHHERNYQQNYQRPRGEIQQSDEEYCRTCHKTHRPGLCNKRLNDDYDSSGRKKYGLACTTQEVERLPPSTYIIDSASEEHYVYSERYLTNAQQCQDLVMVANGMPTKITARGETFIGTDKAAITISNVGLVPEFENNLLSVAKICDKGYRVIFEKDKCVVENAKTRENLFTANRKGNLYLLSGFIPKAYNTWHAKLGHPSQNKVDQFVKRFNLTRTKEEKHRCDNCPLAKSKRSTHKLKRSRNSKRPLELIYADLIGPIEVTSATENRYILHIVDDYSRYGIVYPIRFKSDAIERMREFVKVYEKQTGMPIKKVRSDNGGEFKNFSLEDFLTKLNGTVQEFTAPYTPEQNGVVERRNRTLLETVRTMMIMGNIPKVYWDVVVETANYLINLWINKEKKIPFEAFWNRKVSQETIKSLKTVGCIAYINIQKHNRNGKLDRTGKRVIFIGYTGTNKNYRFIDTESGRIITTSDVTRFDEDRMGFMESDLKIYDQRDYFEMFSKLMPNTEEANNELPTDLMWPVTMDTVTIQSEVIEETNPLPGLRRSSRANFGKKPLKLTMLVSQVYSEPTTLRDVKESKDRMKWEKAMEQEITELVRKDVFEKVNKSDVNQNILKTKWIYKLKDPGTEKQRYKARLVVRGFSQTKGIDYEETYSPTVAPHVIKLVLTLAVTKKLLIKQLDVKTAYLNAELKQTIYVYPPEGQDKPEIVWKLKKALYGLRQSGNAWYNTISDFLQQLGFKKSLVDTALFIRRDCMVVLHVDDVLIVTPQQADIDELMKKLDNQYGIHDVPELDKFLGIEINRKPEELQLRQTNYIIELAETYGLEMSAGASYPISNFVDYTKAHQDESTKSKKIDDKLIRSLIGSLAFVANNTRPDIAFAVNYLSRYVCKPSFTLWNAAKNILKYLVGTAYIHLSIKPVKNWNLQVFVDSGGSHRFEPDMTMGLAIYLDETLIGWASRKDKTVNKSTCEWELSALCCGYVEADQLKQILNQELKIECGLTLFCDNKGTIDQIQRGSFKRHIYVIYRNRLIVQAINSNGVKLRYIRTEYQVADVLTKPLACDAFYTFRHLLCLANDTCTRDC